MTRTESCFLRNLALVASVLVSTNGFSAWNSTGSSVPKAPEIIIVNSTASETVLEYRVSGFDLENVTVAGKTYSMISIPETSFEERAGYPVLPRLSKNLHIPLGSKASWSVEQVDTTEFPVAPVLPSKGELTRNMDPQSVPYTFAPEIYQISRADQGIDFPAVNFTVSDEFKIRSAQGVNVSFYPIQYDAARALIKVMTRATVRIKHASSTRSTKGMRALLDPVDSGWENILKGSFLNEEAIQEVNRNSQTQDLRLTRAEALDTRVTHIMKDTGRVLVITPTGFKETLTPWLRWKTQKGLQVWVSELNTTDQAQVKSIIQNAYNQYKIAYVILVGDAEFVPFHKGKSGNASSAEADPMYGLVDGNDGYPDLTVSRFSAKNPQELAVQLSKAILYETSPDPKGEWYSKSIGIASNEGSPTDWERAEILRKMLEGWHYRQVDKQYDPQASKAELSRQINEGRGFINYIGHGSKSSWGTTGFSNWDVDALTNVGKLPFIVSVACVNGQFGSGSDSFAERWLKAGTVQAPTGAIAIFASSTNQSWVPPTVGQLEINKLLTAEKMNTIGSLFTHGSIAVIEDNSSTAAQTFETWHIFGDATTQVRTQAPVEIDAQVPNQIASGDTELVVKLQEKGIQAGLMQGNRLVGIGISDGSGVMKVKIYNQGLPEAASKEPLLLTLTGFNKFPKAVQIAVR